MDFEVLPMGYLVWGCGFFSFYGWVAFSPLFNYGNTSPETHLPFTGEAGVASALALA